jgi:fluoroquinolone transport system ATP-binding protein
MIHVEHLSHDYDGSGTLAVNDVSFDVNDGEIFGFLGPSGAGKSTVQKILTALLDLQSGAVTYDGVSVRNLDSRFFNTVGVSFEHPNLYAKLTAFENLAFYAGLFDTECEDPVRLLERVNLGADAYKKAGAFSKGMKQRLVFCRALLNRPKILFLDEPTSGLDPSTAEIIKAMIREKRDEGCTVFLTTHNMFTAEQLCDRVAFINNGEIVAMDTPKELKLQYGERAVEVEYEDLDESGKPRREVFAVDDDAEKDRFAAAVRQHPVRTIHTREATLEQIFVQLTGRGLQ